MNGDDSRSSVHPRLCPHDLERRLANLIAAAVEKAEAKPHLGGVLPPILLVAIQSETNPRRCANTVRAGAELKHGGARLPRQTQLLAGTERNGRAIHRQRTDFEQRVGFALTRNCGLNLRPCGE